MALAHSIQRWWRAVRRSGDRRDDYRLAQQALVRAGMSPDTSQEELDIYLEEIRAARTPTLDLLKAGFLAGMGGGAGGPCALYFHDRCHGRGRTAD